MTTRYRQHCEEETIPLFSRAWWLDVVCGAGNWDVVLVEKGGKIQASMPYYMSTPGIISMPPLTQNMGPWLRPIEATNSKQLAREKELMGALIQQLPKFDRFIQQFHYSSTNWLPFFWAGFSQTTRYTYILDDLTDLERVFGEFSHAKRKNIKRAEKEVTVHFDLPKEDFYSNHKMTLHKQGEQITYSRDLFFRIHDAACERKSGRIIYARDNDGAIHSALFLVWDKASAYNLISTIDPDHRKSGSASLLIKTAIEYLSKFVNKFDFEGSMTESVENSFRQFGARQFSYSRITKDNRSEIERGLARLRNRASAYAKRFGQKR